MQVGRLTHVAQVRGVDLYIHWTIFLIVGLLLVGSNREPLTTLAAVVGYLGLLILHEWGHVMAARLQGYEAFSIALYPIFGLASLEIPEPRFDRALISWGGVAAQIAVAIPVVLYVSLWGYTSVEALNAVLVIFGNYSLCAAAFNLLPIRPLDGSVAWGIIPAYCERRRAT